MLHKLISWLLPKTHTNRTTPSPCTSHTKLTLEPLEDRIAPAVYVVETLFDVSGLAPASGSGTESDPFRIGSLRSAIEQSNASVTEDDTIQFNPLLSGGVFSLGLGQLNITDDVTITALGTSGVTVNGNVGGRVFRIDDFDSSTFRNVILDGLTITGGFYLGNGAGILNNENLTLTNSNLSGNAASGVGGGLFNDIGQVTVNASTISGNAAVLHGGGLYFSHGTLTVQDSFITGNTASGNGLSIFPTKGGGLFNGNAEVTILDSTIHGNLSYGHTYDRPVGSLRTTNGRGGGLYNDGTMSVRNSTISGNGATEKGGGVMNNGTMMIDDATVITGNIAARDGGGVQNYSGTLTVANSTITGNSAVSDGGGLANRGNVTVRDSIISGNSTTGFFVPGYIFDLTIFTERVFKGLGGGVQNPATCRCSTAPSSETSPRTMAAVWPTLRTAGWKCSIAPFPETAQKTLMKIPAPFPDSAVALSTTAIDVAEQHHLRKLCGGSWRWCAEQQKCEAAEQYHLRKRFQIRRGRLA